MLNDPSAKISFVDVKELVVSTTSDTGDEFPDSESHSWPLSNFNTRFSMAGAGTPYLLSRVRRSSEVVACAGVPPMAKEIATEITLIAILNMNFNVKPTFWGQLDGVPQQWVPTRGDILKSNP